MDIFEVLLGRVPANTAADQTIALRTAKGNIHVLENYGVQNGDYACEDAFLRSLAEQVDTEVTHLVCLWHDGWPDLPSLHFRKGLLEINGNNEDAGILLQGEHRYLVKSLQATLPPQKK